MSLWKILLGAWLISDRDAPIRNLGKFIYKVITIAIVLPIVLVGGCLSKSERGHRSSTTYNEVRIEQSIKKENPVTKAESIKKEITKTENSIKESVVINEEVKETITDEDIVTYITSLEYQNIKQENKNPINNMVIKKMKRDGFIGFPTLFTTHINVNNVPVSGYINFKDETYRNLDVNNKYIQKFLPKIQAKYVSLNFLIECYVEIEDKYNNDELKEMLKNFYNSSINIFKEKETGNYYIFECYDIIDGKIRYKDIFKITYLPDYLNI